MSFAKSLKVKLSEPFKAKFHFFVYFFSFLFLFVSTGSTFSQISTDFFQVKLKQGRTAFVPHKKKKSNPEMNDKELPREENSTDSLADRLDLQESYTLLTLDFSALTKPNDKKTQTPLYISSIEKVSRRLSTFHSLNSPPLS